MPLTPKQRAYLKSLAHPLKPILQIGKEGATDAVVGTIDGAFRTRELLKVKVLESSPESAREVAASLAERVDRVELVQVIGRTIVFYRRHPTNREITLPT
jgi:RNA-binding protein